MLVQALPKVELHLHLEAAVRFQTLHSLANGAGVLLPPEILPTHEQVHRFKSLGHFIKVLSAVNALYSTPRIYGRLMYEALERLAVQNVVYAEIRFSPARPVLDRGLDLGKLLEQLTLSKQQAESEFGIESGLILSLSRNRGVDACTKLAKEAIALSDGQLSGFDMADDEAQWPAYLFHPTFEVIQGAGYPATVHAGEVVGPTSIADAIALPGIRRVGHALTASQDPQLINRLLNQGIHLELCPTSNVRTNQIAKVEDHPLITYLRAGLSISVNSDDPIAFGNDISTEYELLLNKFHLGVKDIEGITTSAADAAFAPDCVKARVRSLISQGHRGDIRANSDNGEVVL